MTFELAYIVSVFMYVVTHYWYMMIGMFVGNWLLNPFLSKRVEWMTDRTYTHGFWQGIISMIIFPVMMTVFIMIGWMSGP